MTHCSNDSKGCITSSEIGPEITRWESFRKLWISGDDKNGSCKRKVSFRPSLGRLSACFCRLLCGRLFVRHMIAIPVLQLAIGQQDGQPGLRSENRWLADSSPPLGAMVVRGSGFETKYFWCIWGSFVYYCTWEWLLYTTGICATPCKCRANPGCKGSNVPATFRTTGPFPKITYRYILSELPRQHAPSASSIQFYHQKR